MIMPVYIHIPFCLSRCTYCSFVSSRYREDLAHAYVDAVLAEAHARIPGCVLPAEYTLYIGGGTPSVLPPKLIIHLVTGLRDALREAGGLCERECTFEVNPGSTSNLLVRTLRDLGVTRVSMGVQSFNADRLRLLGRSHTVDQVHRALALFGLDIDISLDLITALPDDSVERTLADVVCACQLNPHHISLYTLSLEPDTPLAKQLRVSGQVLPTEDTAAELMETAADALAHHGYEQYEVSNFSLPEHRALHNSLYWTGTDYLGLGAGAVSTLHGVRYRNEADVETFIRKLDTGEDAYADVEHVRAYDQFQERIMLGLRTVDGLDIPALQRTFPNHIPPTFNERLQTLESEGYLRRTCNNICPTRKGLLTADGITTWLLS